MAQYLWDMLNWFIACNAVHPKARPVEITGGSKHAPALARGRRGETARISGSLGPSNSAESSGNQQRPALGRSVRLGISPIAPLVPAHHASKRRRVAQESSSVRRCLPIRCKALRAHHPTPACGLAARNIRRLPQCRRASSCRRSPPLARLPAQIHLKFFWSRGSRSFLPRRGIIQDIRRRRCSLNSALRFHPGPPGPGRSRCLRDPPLQGGLETSQLVAVPPAASGDLEEHICRTKSARAAAPARVLEVHWSNGG
jgi:hypothetical protein